MFVCVRVEASEIIWESFFEPLFIDLYGKLCTSVTIFFSFLSWIFFVILFRKPVESIWELMIYSALL